MTERQTPWWNKWMDQVDDWADRVGAFCEAQVERLIQSFRRRKKRTT